MSLNPSYESTPKVTSTSTSPLVVVVDSDPRMRMRIAMQLGDLYEAAAYGSLEEMAERVFPSDRMICLLGPSFSTPDELERATAVCRERPGTQSILFADVLTTAVLQQAIRAGVSDVLAFPLEETTLDEAISRAAALLPAEVVGGSMPTVSAPTHGSKGRAITVFSTKGGAGKSVVASNLAVCLAARTTRPVVLLDADLQFGDIAVMLKLTPQRTIVDAVNSIERLDAESVRDLLIRHERSGLYVLPAPTEPAFADQIDTATMARIINLLKEFAAYVVIDTPSSFNEVVLNLVEASDDIVLVAGMDIPNIKNVKIGLQVLRLLEVPSSKLKLVLNRSNSKVKLDISEVERTLQLKADCLVPSDMLLPKSVNKGVPAVLEEPRSAVTRAIEGLADQLLVGQGAQKQRA